MDFDFSPAQYELRDEARRFLAKECATITAWWDEALHTALARFQTQGGVDALDQVMACLPAWAGADSGTRPRRP